MGDFFVRWVRWFRWFLDSPRPLSGAKPKKTATEVRQDWPSSHDDHSLGQSTGQQQITISITNAYRIFPTLAPCHIRPQFTALNRAQPRSIAFNRVQSRSIAFNRVQSRLK